MFATMHRSFGLAGPVGALFAISLLAGCAAVTPRSALPEAAAASVEPEGFHNIRYWGDETALNASAMDAGPPIATAELHKRNGANHQLNLLAISGGAEDGAFGAGLLAGWATQGPGLRSTW